ncbi:MAG: hypothetical protein K6D03_10810 [Solobacterium sp.]|nr:hypothetical protein [Solobacterium sp.]
MKKALADTAKIVLKTALAAALFVMTWNFLTPYFRVNRNEEGDEFRNLPENTIDVIALGSSHIQYAFNPAVFYTETGKYSYVLGSACQPFSMSYYMLEEALKTQHPSVVLVDLFTLLPESQVCYAEGLYYKAMDMMSGETRYNAGRYAAETLPDDLQYAYTYDLILNHDNWKNMDFTDPDSIKANAAVTTAFLDDMGYVKEEPTVFQYTPIEYPEPNLEITLSEEETKWIDKMIDLCDAEGIHLFFLKTPYAIQQSDSNKLNAIWKYLDEKGAFWIDYGKIAGEIDWFLDMDGNTWHNNTWGAEIITRHIAETVTGKGWIRNHKYNETVENLLKGLQLRTAKSLMNYRNINIFSMMTFAAKYPCTVLLRFSGNKRGNITAYINESLYAVGFRHDFLNDRADDYYAVVKNGKLVKDGNEPFEYTLDGNTYTFTPNDIWINGDSLNTFGEMQIYFYSNEGDWLNTIAVDFSQHSFWKNGCTSWDCTVNP